MQTDREVGFTLTHRDTTTTLRFTHMMTGIEVTLSFPDDLPIELEAAALKFLDNLPQILDSAAEEINSHARR